MLPGRRRGLQLQLPPQSQSQFPGSPFPQGPWVKDDALEGLVSTMYSTLAGILAVSRTAPGHRRACEELRVKNDMLHEELRNKNDMLISLMPQGGGYMGGAYSGSMNGYGNGGGNNNSGGGQYQNVQYARQYSGHPQNKHLSQNQPNGQQNFVSQSYSQQ